LIFAVMHTVYITSPDVSQEGLKFYRWTSFLSFLFITSPCSAAALWMAIKCTPEVRS